VPAPVTQSDAEKRAASGGSLDLKDWYFARKQLEGAARK